MIWRAYKGVYDHKTRQILVTGEVYADTSYRAVLNHVRKYGAWDIDYAIVPDDVRITHILTGDALRNRRGAFVI